MPRGSGDKTKKKGEQDQTSHTETSVKTVDGASTQVASSNSSTLIDNSDIKKLISRIDGLADQMKTISTDLSTIKDDVKSLKELKKEVDEVKETANNAFETAENNSEDINKLKGELSAARDSIKILQTDTSSLREYIVQQDAYSRRDNLLFDKVPENNDEDCVQVIRRLFVENLKIDEPEAAQIKIVRCHRMGKPKQGAIRTIICRFHYFGDKENVRKRGSELKNSEIRMSEDFPKEIIAQRNALAPIMFEARRMKMKAFLVAEKLIIDSKQYTVKTLNTLPEPLKTLNVGVKKVADNITAFYGSLCLFSNYRFAPFTATNGIFYHSSEQFLHHNKAIIFNDSVSAAKILATKTPNESKSLGRNIQNFEFVRWKRHAKDIMKEGLRLKFSQNKLCYEALAATGDTTLVEASVTDKLWGAGVGLNNPDIGNQQSWQGSNWMGEVLQEVRSDLIG